jgi:hypothetical protein
VRQYVPPAPPPELIDEFVDRTLEAFELACDGPPTELRRLTIAGRPVAIRFRSPALADRYRAAIARVALDDSDPTPGAPALTIGCWDTATTGVGIPPLPWIQDNLLHRDRVRGHTTGDIRATYQQSKGLLHLYDARRALGLMHATSPAAVPAWTDRAPFRTFVGWWATDLGLSMMHASCVATEDGAALIAGRSGSGKSTTAMTCVLAGFGFLCDDACIVDLDDVAGPLVHAVYGGSKLEPEAAHRLGLSPDAAGEPHLSEPTGAVGCARARVLLLPQITGRRETRLEELPRTEVLRQLVPGSIREGGGLGGRALQEMTRVVRTVPSRRILLGTDPAGVAAAVAQAIAGP